MARASSRCLHNKIAGGVNVVIYFCLLGIEERKKVSPHLVGGGAVDLASGNGVLVCSHGDVEGSWMWKRLGRGGKGGGGTEDPSAVTFEGYGCLGNRERHLL